MEPTLMKEKYIGDDNTTIIFDLRYTDGCIVSAGPAPMPFKTQAPMKLPYVVALARHIILPRQTTELQIKTGRRPKLVEIGTQMKLENPRTRIHTPVYRQIYNI